MTAATWKPKSNPQWNGMQHGERVSWISGLTDRQIVEQAGVRARASGRTVAEILGAWTLNGFISYEHKAALTSTLAGLAALTPAEFYDLAERDPFRAGLALAQLGRDGRFAFAAACGQHLEALYGRAIPALVVEATWHRAGLVEA